MIKSCYLYLITDDMKNGFGEKLSTRGLLKADAIDVKSF